MHREAAAIRANAPGGAGSTSGRRASSSLGRHQLKRTEASCQFSPDSSVCAAASMAKRLLRDRWSGTREDALLRDCRGSQFTQESARCRVRGGWSGCRLLRGAVAYGRWCRRIFFFGPEGDTLCTEYVMLPRQLGNLLSPPLLVEPETPPPAASIILGQHFLPAKLVRAVESLLFNGAVTLINCASCLGACTIYGVPRRTQVLRTCWR